MIVSKKAKRTLVALVAVAASVGAFAAGGVANAAAAPQWKIVASPNAADPSDLAYGGLAGVSCPTATNCATVGFAEDNAEVGPALGDRWNGGAWSATNPLTPAGDEGAGLEDVVCASPSSCTAVGSATTASGSGATLAEQWSGTRWTIVPTPEPAAFKIGGLNSLSCIGQTACMAVGSYYAPNGDQISYAERRNGSTWSVVPTPTISGAEYTNLLTVSCTSASACTAVGTDGTSSSAYRALAEQWNGSTWKVVPTPNPSGAELTILQSVSCTSASACTAVGFYYPNIHEEIGFAEVWNGVAWSLSSIAAPDGMDDIIEGISCTSATSCTAVGGYDNYDAFVPLVEQLSGSTWTIESTPSPADTDPVNGSYLDAVSCTSATSCTAVGGNETSTEQYDTLVETLSR